MAPVEVTCPRDGCEWTAEAEAAIGAVLLTDHLETMHPRVQLAKPPPLPLPRLNGQISTESFEEFVREWENWRASSNVENAKASGYLINCCEASLKAEIQASVANVTGKTVAEVLAMAGVEDALSRQIIVFQVIY